MTPRFLAFVLGALLFGAPLVVADCRPGLPAEPGIVTFPADAAVQTVDGVCTLLEGITQDRTVLDVCATVEEIATIAAFIALHVRRDLGAPDAAAPCTVVANMCATSEELGPALQFILAKRVAKITAKVPR